MKPSSYSIGANPHGPVVQVSHESSWQRCWQTLRRVRETLYGATLRSLSSVTRESASHRSIPDRVWRRHSAYLVYSAQARAAGRRISSSMVVGVDSDARNH